MTEAKPLSAEEIAQLKHNLYGPRTKEIVSRLIAMIERQTKQIEKLRVALVNLLNASEPHIFSTECQSERDAALSDLIARLKAAKEGSLKLEREIAEVVGWQSDRDNDLGFPPLYTRSLDAALTLVPDNFVVSIQIGPGRIRYAAVGLYETCGATPELAHCIAALKAREARR